MDGGSSYEPVLFYADQDLRRRFMPGGGVVTNETPGGGTRGSRFSVGSLSRTSRRICLVLARFSW